MFSFTLHSIHRGSRVKSMVSVSCSKALPANLRPIILADACCCKMAKINVPEVSLFPESAHNPPESQLARVLESNNKYSYIWIRLPHYFYGTRFYTNLLRSSPIQALAFDYSFLFSSSVVRFFPLFHSRGKWLISWLLAGILRAHRYHSYFISPVSYLPCYGEMLFQHDFRRFSSLMLLTDLNRKSFCEYLVSSWWSNTGDLSLS